MANDDDATAVAFSSYIQSTGLNIWLLPTGSEVIGGRKTRKSGSQGSPRPSTSKGGAASQPIVKLGSLSGGSMSFTKRLAKDMAIAKRSSGRKSFAKILDSFD